ncbi:hypothetical protein F6X68_07530 [Micromonospora sp. AMSO12t]|uniref:hypothetical protein n=1 Tax=Micromonospora sp. AMSO12t TaxID=2650410 RepID=UPI00124B94C4|nr:hypothetical protein [Micromonospora sp. AMSO12t]KAB1160275.1 hypothetical protein F6X68_07530 [Micromonospora sp. AMSO12t]
MPNDRSRPPALAGAGEKSSRSGVSPLQHRLPHCATWRARAAIRAATRATVGITTRAPSGGQTDHGNSTIENCTLRDRSCRRTIFGAARRSFQSGTSAPDGAWAHPAAEHRRTARQRLGAEVRRLVFRATERHESKPSRQRLGTPP